MADTWAKERADAIVHEVRQTILNAERQRVLSSNILAALNEAEQRGANEWLERRKRAFGDELEGAYQKGRDSILARLREPDEAMIEAVSCALDREEPDHIRATIRALAAVLSPPEEEKT